MSIGAGDKRSTENGALSSATSGPHFWRLLKPNRMSAIAVADRTNPTRAILMLCWRGVGVRGGGGRGAIAREENDARQQHDQPIRIAPAQRSGEEPGDDEGERAGDRRDARQHPQRRFLLPAVVVRGDQHHERRYAGAGG